MLKRIVSVWFFSMDIYNGKKKKKRKYTSGPIMYRINKKSIEEIIDGKAYPLVNHPLMELT